MPEENAPRIVMYGLKLPEVKPGDDLAELIVKAAEEAGAGIEDNDVIVVASKIVSKAKGLLYRIDQVTPSKKARKIAEKAGLDPRFVEIVLKESTGIVAAVPIKNLVETGLIRLDKLFATKEAWKLLEKYPTLLITTKNGSIWSDAGLDSSNHPPGVYSHPPRNPDKEARELSEAIQKLTGKKAAVIISDTEIFLRGSIDVARGSHGIPPVDRGFGKPDAYGKPKYGGVDTVADELAAAAALLMKQTNEAIPAVIIRGLNYTWTNAGIQDHQIIKTENLPRILAATLKHTAKVLGTKKAAKLILKTIQKLLTS